MASTFASFYFFKLNNYMASKEDIERWEKVREKIKELKDVGKKNKEIADILGIWERQVYIHLAKIKWVDSKMETTEKETKSNLEKEHLTFELNKQQEDNFMI